MVTRKNRMNSWNKLFKKGIINISRKDFELWLRKTGIRSIISAVVLGLVLIIQMLNFEPPKAALNYIEAKLEYNASLNDYIAEARKFTGHIAALGDRALEAMKIENKMESRFILPTDGKILTYFNENIGETSNISKGIIFSSDQGENIYAIDSGVVIDMGSNKSIGNYVIIKHRGEFLSVYKYLESNVVEINQRVEKGQIIGTGSEKLLLEVWHRNEAIDPIQYMDLSAMQL